MYYKKLKQPTIIAIVKYKQCKKHLDKVLKLNKKLYFERKMFETSKNMKARWDAIRLLINKNKNKTNNCPIKHSTLGKHYSTIAENLNSKLPNVECNIVQGSKETNIVEFCFNPVDDATIYDTINTLNTKKGPGLDDISAKILKTTAGIVAPHLSLIFNECLRQGTYPDIFKVALCRPIFKGGDLDPEDPLSYRPISLLNATNKVFEKILHDQLMLHLESNNILPTFQFGYRKNIIQAKPY